MKDKSGALRSFQMDGMGCRLRENSEADAFTGRSSLDATCRRRLRRIFGDRVVRQVKQSIERCCRRRWRFQSTNRRSRPAVLLEAVELEDAMQEDAYAQAWMDESYRIVTNFK